MALYSSIKNTKIRQFQNKLDKIDDMVVFDQDLPKNCAVSFVDFAPMPKPEIIRSVKYS